MQLSLRRWTGALIAIAAVMRAGVGLMSFFAIGPLSGLTAYSLWNAWGNGPIVMEWLVAGLLVAAGIITATRVPSIRTYQLARATGWFVVADTIVYVGSITVVLVAELDAAENPWWKLLAAVMMANTALGAMGVVVIRKASSIHRSRRDPRVDIGSASSD